ncbi:NADH-ubiquinone oxidoreductase-F iron-sulfur binding region domain-containing protein [Actinoplanes sp. RD1]|uniref:NADH-ubiquinone oxidoreductase-F iron-sulfur binding region domain-containing protein n=1 Tax=Actinoplanes sp. RD1 TaxID=3064538 RepID=UPI0027407BB3|nr:NADH-ubiquinone oxidoreductase-F iron-sulfur binding region domain-containing protein [Actinoplanes sp. RD1]
MTTVHPRPAVEGPAVESPAMKRPAVERRVLAGTDERFVQPDLARLIAMLGEAGLAGRGGAGFPTWRKLDAVAKAGRAPVVIGNGAEGEPLSGKDRTLLTHQPHLVLDGLQIVARALGATTTHLYVHPAAHAPMRAAIGTRNADVHLTVAPDAFVAGEESAVVNALAGRAAVPSDKRIRITQAGLGGAPTLVQNVETLAHIALIVRFGPRWFRTAGTPDEPGTFLATVGGAVAAPGVLEAGYGVRLGDLVDAAGGPVRPPQAVLLGGYHGGWVPAWPELEVSRAALAAYGGSPGAGIVHVLPASVCGLAETARITGYLAGQVAGQCGPCVNGLPRLATTLADLAARRARPGLEQEVARLSALVQGRGACRHPDGTVRLVQSAMRAFAADVTAHLHGECLAEGAR